MLFEAIAQLNQKANKMPLSKTKKLNTTSNKQPNKYKGSLTHQQRKYAKTNTRRRRQVIKKLTVD